MTKKLFILLAAIGMIMPQMASAQDFEVDGIYYNTSGSDATVTYFTRKVGRTTKTTDSYSGIVVIPATVTYNDVTYNVTNIGKNAFLDCPRLTSVTIPNSVTNIEVGAFRGCSGLTSVTVESGNTHYDSRDNCNAIIETSSNTLIVGCKNTIIPNSVTRIGDYAFYKCSVTSVTIPNSVTSIGSKAFYGCSGLTSITIGSSVKTIGDYAFDRCSGLTSVTIPNSVTSIGDYVFRDCTSLPVIENIRYADCVAVEPTDKSLSQYKIKGGTRFICSYAFKDCSSLTSITIPNSVTSIGDYAFSGCSGLTSVTIPNSVTSIGTAAFYDCTGLTSVTIPNSVTSIGYAAFYDCTGLTSVTVPNSVTSIGDYAFRGCSGLTSVTIPNSVTSIGDYAFYGCDNLRTIISLSVTPPSCFNNTFGSTTYDSAILYVPDTEGTLTLYQTATAWKNFKNIVANDLTGINNNRMSATTPASLINLNGQYISNAQRGIMMQKMPNGTTKKVLMR